jgi:predicted ArsR family transcriptional regulator
MSTRESQDVLPAVGKKYSAEILVATAEPRSAQELSDDLDIPIATCYRRIDELVDQGLLEAHGTHVVGSNREETVYRRSADDITVDFSDSISVSVESRSSKRKIDRIWRKLQHIRNGASDLNG